MKDRLRPAPTRHGSIVRGVVAVAFAGLLVASCRDAAGPEQLQTLTMTPAATTVGPSGTVALTAVGTRAGTDVTNLVGQTFAVTSGGGTVSATGVFIAPTTVGTSTITVTCGGRTATATVTVIAGPLATITVTPNPVTLAIGATQQFTAVGRDAFGNIVAITPVWSTTNPPGGINATGLFTAGNTLGTFANSVRATVGAISGTATVTVIAGPLASITVTPNPVTLAIGAQQQFTAVGRDASGNVVPIPNLVWSTTNPPGAINATGLFTAGNTVGTFDNSVRATSGAIFGTATVTVIAGPLVSITVTPNPVTLGVGVQQQFTAVGRDAGGNVVPIPSLVWSTTTPPGTINATTGLFTAGNTLGVFANSVTATSGAISGTATVTVIPGPLASITVTPNPVTLVIGAAQQFTAVGNDAGGNVVPIPNLVWSTTNPPGIINAGTGLFAAGNTIGVFNNSVTATSGAVSGSATVTVIAGPLVTITVSPNPVTLNTTEQQQFTAVGTDAGGNVVPTPGLVWSTTNPPGAINVNTGLFTAGNTTGIFANSVTATSGAVSGRATVTVTAVAPALGHRFVAFQAFTCTNGSIIGDVATNQLAAEAPPGSVTQTPGCIVGNIDIGSPVAKQAFQDFLTDFAALEAAVCDVTLVGTLAGVTLAPNQVYCFDNAATLTGVLTLDGTPADTWLIKVGQAGIPGALSGTNFTVLMAGGASPCNVTWWVRQAATMVTSDFKGHILAGAGVSFTDNTYRGNAWSQADVTVTGTDVRACDAP